MSHRNRMGNWSPRREGGGSDGPMGTTGN